jgi:hypothetical protein
MDLLCAKFHDGVDNVENDQDHAERDQDAIA